jgi:hypothetical protein
MSEYRKEKGEAKKGGFGMGFETPTPLTRVVPPFRLRTRHLSVSARMREAPRAFHRMS